MSRPQGKDAAIAAGGPADRLGSWKDIAAYLQRDVSTVQRWEKREGMPVHRHLHGKLGSVYAFRSEIDVWWANRSILLGEQDRAPEDQNKPSVALRSGPGTHAVRKGAGWTPWLGIAALAASAVAAITFALDDTRTADPQAFTIRSLAVLPLANLSADASQEYFALGMTDELIGALARISALRVVSRTSAMSLNGSNKSLPAIARELNVDAVLEGSVQRAGDRVRIRIQLIHAPTDSHLWAGEFERQLTDVLTLQNEIAREVAQEIHVSTTPQERTRMASAVVVNPAAHDEYLLGRYLLWKFIEEDRVRAVEHFNRAIQIDPGYAAAHAGLAHAWWIGGVFGPLSMKEAAPPASAAARRALELDDRLAEAHAAKAYVEGMFDWNWKGAEATARHAIEIDPNSLEAHYVYSLLLMALGRLPEAITQIDRAAQLDPLSAQVHSTFGRILYRARRWEEAIARLQRAIELEPRNAGAYSRLGNVYEQMGKFEDALAAYAKQGALLGQSDGERRNTARLYAAMGKADEARRILGSHTDRWPEVHAALGDKKTAFAVLFKSVNKRQSDTWPLYVMADPQYESLRGDPQWNELLARMNFVSN
jgi:TolB-like protein/Tfp pilus assembly protein PilF